MSKTSTVVLISGINGFIATEIAHTFLRAGYTVRGTVRTQGNADAWQALFPQYASQLQFAPAVKGVDYFLHAASPLGSSEGSKENEKDVLIPAINGTLAAVRAAAKEPGVKKLVLSFRHSEAGVVYGESGWNTLSYEWAKTAPPMAAYGVSKALSEKKAAWDLVEKKKPNIALVAINPTCVYGPTRIPLDYKGTNGFIAKILLDPSCELTTVLGGPNFVDVRDIAAAHLLAVKNDAENGRRFIVTAPTLFPTDYVRIFAAELPELADKLRKAPEGFKNPETYTLDNTASKEVLAVKYHTSEQTLRDTAAWILLVAGQA